MGKSDQGPSRRRIFRNGIDVCTGLMAAAALPAAASAPSTGNETLKTIQSLRTIHGDFSDKRVPDSDVEVILDACVRAANASNMQSYSIIVSRDPAKIKKLTGYTSGCMLLFCADYVRIVDTAKLMGYDYFADNAEAFVTSSTNTILAAQTAVIAARSMGIDSLLTNGIHRGDMERNWEILDLPQIGCFPLIALLLGYPKTEPGAQKGRLKGAGVVHQEKYRHATKEELEKIILQHDDPAAHLALNDEWKSKGYKHYLDWFYKDWSRAGKATTAEGRMAKRLRKSGFIEPQSA